MAQSFTEHLIYIPAQILSAIFHENLLKGFLLDAEGLKSEVM